MAKYVNSDERRWESKEIVGHKMERCVLWNGGHNVTADLVPMPKGKNLGHHRHETWIQVFIVSGKMEVLPDNKIIDAGGYFFVEPGDEHTEIALEDTLVLVIREEPNKQYPIPEQKQ